MDDYRLNLKLYIVLNGYFKIKVGDTIYKVVYPSLEDKYRAEELYVNIMDSGRFDIELMNNHQVDSILSHYDVWKPEMDERLDFCKKSLEQQKIELYKEYSNKDLKDKIKAEIQQLKKILLDLTEKKHSMDYLKLEYFATSSKNQYLLSQRIIKEDGTKVFDEDYNELDTSKLSKFLKPIEENCVTSQNLRDIAKTDNWLSYAVTDNIFGPSINLNDDQRNLLALHRMYTNVRQHPECPSDEIINDDDALDGWFLFQQQKRENEKTKNKLLDRVRGKVKNHSDIFIFTQDEKESKAIWDMNNAEGKMTIKSIEKSIGDMEGETIEWQDIPIVRQQLIDEKTKGSKI